MEVLGLNPILLLAQLISFGILFLVLKKFLYGNLRKSLEDRRKVISQIAEKNIEVEKRIEELEAEKIKLEDKNQEKLRKLLLDSQKDAEEIKKDILIEAEEKSKKIIEEATEKILQEKTNATEELKKEAGKLATALAAKILTTPENSVKTVDISIKELEKLSGTKNK
jgi:F-type H+-transporting ATPase subunit b